MGRYDMRAGISKWRYRELKAICMQYEEKKRAGDKLADIIEETAQKTDPAMARAILANVTGDVRYEYSGCMAGRSSFYRARQAFFRLLDARLRAMRSEGEMSN